MLVIVLTALLSVFLVIISLNFIPGEKTITKKIEHLYGIESSYFQSAVSHLLGPSLLPGNSVQALVNGVEIFPAMLDAIGKAQSSVCFETYIFWSGSIGNKFAEALIERARAGVAVHVIMDAIGSLKSEHALIRKMRRGGVRVVHYHPLSWHTLTKMNNRTHRKLLIVDGKIGFTGGVGVSDEWLGDADSADHWRDTQVKIEGPVVAHLQSAFMDNWLKTKSQVLHGPNYFPLLTPQGNALAQVFKSSSHEGSESARLLFLLSIACAQKSVNICASYFLPDRLMIKTMCEAKDRGVDIQIIVPGPMGDQPEVRVASRSLWGKLLAKGIQIFEYQPTMYHTKAMIVDEVWSSIGSINFDNRSFRLNDEANLNCLDREFAAVLSQHFTMDKAHSHETSYSDWQARPFSEKVVAFFLRTIHSQL
jgi:cardiolipin synthase